MASGEEIELVKEFQYLDADNERIDAEVDRRIANASKAFGAIRQAVFNKHLTQRLIYQACVLSVLLHIWR